jgi:hypothetical protein
MKRNPSLFIILTLSCCFFISCKKDPDNNSSNNNNNNNTTSDSNYVDRIIIIDSTAGVEDTSQLEIYSYDNLKRVTVIVDSMLTPTPTLFAFKQFEYAGNDSLPFKSTLYIYDGSNRDTVITYHYFNNAGRLIRDSIINISNNLTYYQTNRKLIDISYSGNMMYGFSRDSTLQQNNIPSTYPALIITDTITLDANGNMIYTIQHRGTSTTSISTNSFDSHPHPMRRLNIFMCWSHNIFQNRYYDPTQQNTNNITHVLETASGSQNYTHDFNLINSYYENGFLKTTAHPESAGSALYEKYLFIYKSL